MSPAKLKSVAKNQRLPATKRKFDQIAETAINKITNVYGIDPITTMTSSCTPSIASIDKLNNNTLDTLLSELKDKLKIVISCLEKIQIILTPQSWSHACGVNIICIWAAEFFNVFQDFVTIGYRQHMQKSLLLSILNHSVCLCNHHQNVKLLGDGL